MFWVSCSGCFFVPVFGMALGDGLGALMGKVEKTGIDNAFRAQVRDLVRPGTSALFLIVERASPDKAIAALSRFGGTILKSSLSEEDETCAPGGVARRRRHHGMSTTGTRPVGEAALDAARGCAVVPRPAGLGAGALDDRHVDQPDRSGVGDRFAARPGAELR